MQIDPILRARAASALLDSVSVVDLEDDGTDQADRRMILALAEIVDLESESEGVRATVAAATDLLWGLTKLLSQYRNESRETTVSNVRTNVLAAVYPEAFGD